MTQRPLPGQPIPLDAKKVFTGVLFDVYQWEQEMFDGSFATFEKLRRADTVSVIPITTDGRIMIIEDEQPGRNAVITFPGGRVEPGEDAEDAAKREFLEETGYAPASITLWRAHHPVSKLDWVLYHFIARGCEKAAEPHMDPGERIKVRFVTLDELIALADDPRFQGADLLVDLAKARLNPADRKALEERLFGV